MRIMTMNIWGDYFGNPVDVRIGGILETIKKYSPDVVGMQEVTSGWYNSGLIEALSEEYAPVEAAVGNYTPLFYKREKFNLAKRGWELLSETPDKSKSITWAVLESVDSGKRFAVCNTHFWWKYRNPDDDRIRVCNAAQLFDIAGGIHEKHGIPVFAFGDLNCREGSPALEYLNERSFTVSYRIADNFTDISSHHGDPKLGEDGKYHGSRTENKIGESIDQILTFRDGAHVTDYTVVCDQSALDATDHSPVFIDALI